MKVKLSTYAKKNNLCYRTVYNHLLIKEINESR